MPPYPWHLAWQIGWTVMAVAWVVFAGWLVWLVWSEKLDVLSRASSVWWAKGDRHGTHTPPPEPPAPC